MFILMAVLVTIALIVLPKFKIVQRLIDQVNRLTRENLEKHGYHENVLLREGDALNILEDLESFQVLLVGGSSGDLSSIVTKGWSKLAPNGRIVVTSILMETRVEAVDVLKKLGTEPDVVEATIAKGKITPRGTLMMGRNPITIVSAVKGD